MAQKNLGGKCVPLALCALLILSWLLVTLIPQVGKQRHKVVLSRYTMQASGGDHLSLCASQNLSVGSDPPASRPLVAEAKLLGSWS